MDSWMCIHHRDNKIMARLPTGHKERIELYTKRYSESKNIFTGEPLSAIEYKQREETERKKAETAKRGLPNQYGVNQYVNNEISS